MYPNVCTDYIVFPWQTTPSMSESLGAAKAKSSSCMYFVDAFFKLVGCLSRTKQLTHSESLLHLDVCHSLYGVHT